MVLRLEEILACGINGQANSQWCGEEEKKQALFDKAKQREKTNKQTGRKKTNRKKKGLKQKKKKKKKKQLHTL